MKRVEISPQMESLIKSARQVANESDAEGILDSG